MASIEPYETDNGRRYRIRYRDPEHRSRERGGFTTKRAAQQYLAELTVATTRGEYVAPNAGRVTVSELGPLWLSTLTHMKPSALAPLEIAWRCYVAPRWGATEISRIVHSDVQVWVSQLVGGTAVTSKRQKRALGATSVIRAHSVLASILDLAVKDRRLNRNPAREVNLPRKVRKPHGYLTHRQVELLASQAGGHGTLVRFLAYTGLRWGEATALRVGDLDMLRRRLTISQNAVRVNGKIIVGTPKSHHTRSVPFPVFIAAEIAEQCVGKTREQLVFGNGLTHLQQPTSATGWYSASIARAQAIDPDIPRLTVHDLRHTAASLAISAGANVKAVQRMLGHASAAMTLDVYSDLFDDDLMAVSDALDAARREQVVGDLWGLDPEAAFRASQLPRISGDVDAKNNVLPLGVEPRLWRF
jgi:integrase